MSIELSYKKLKARYGTNLFDVGKLYRRASLKILSDERNSSKGVQWQEIQDAFRYLQFPDIAKQLVTDYRPAAQKRSDRTIEKREILTYKDKLKEIGYVDSIYDQSAISRGISVAASTPPPEQSNEIDHEAVDDTYNEKDDGNNHGAVSDTPLAVSNASQRICEEQPVKHENLKNDGLSLKCLKAVPVLDAASISASSSNHALSANNSSKLKIPVATGRSMISSTSNEFETRQSGVSKTVDSKTSDTLRTSESVCKDSSTIEIAESAVSGFLKHPPKATDAAWKAVLWASVEIALTEDAKFVKKQQVDTKLFDHFQLLLKKYHNEPQRKCRIKGYITFDKTHNAVWQITDFGFETAHALFD